jgi:hypothetical protein
LLGPPVSAGVNWKLVFLGVLGDLGGSIVVLIFMASWRLGGSIEFDLALVSPSVPLKGVLKRISAVQFCFWFYLRLSAFICGSIECSLN